MELQELGQILCFCPLRVFSPCRAFSSCSLSGVYGSRTPLWVCPPFLRMSFALVLLEALGTFPLLEVSTWGGGVSHFVLPGSRGAAPWLVQLVGVMTPGLAIARGRSPIAVGVLPAVGGALLSPVERHLLYPSCWAYAKTCAPRVWVFRFGGQRPGGRRACLSGSGASARSCHPDTVEAIFGCSGN